MLKPLMLMLLAFMSLGAVAKQENYLSIHELIRSSNLMGNNSQADENLIEEKIKVQVLVSYEKQLKKVKNHDLAYEQIKNQIDKDVALIIPTKREHIKNIAYSALDAISGGLYNSKSNVNLVKNNVPPKNNNEEEEEILDEDINDSERKNFQSKQEFISFLTSPRPSVRWVSRAGQDMSSLRLKRSEQKLSVQMKVEFLGASIDAGPIVKFTKNLSTIAVIMAEGAHPILKADGNFDFYKYDSNGKKLIKGGQPVRRFMSVTCKVDMNYESEGAMAAGIRFKGLGLEGAEVDIINNAVVVASRRVLVPEFIDGKTVTVKYLSELCHNDFVKAHIANNATEGSLTVEESLNKQMENYLANIRVSHPKMNCLKDSQCKDWFKYDILYIHQAGNFPRCVSNKDEGYMYCQVKGLDGQKCPVFDSNGKKLSDGYFEYPCDEGLSCVTVQEASWMKYAVGKCRPKDEKYKRPKFKSEYIEVDIVSIP